ncbi:MAG TPA: hypothetical protein VHM02_02085 [Thermoanaerobaculia bacterium]|nr:hypothetical protein [Thermoanaerobaculia bacterium]
MATLFDDVMAIAQDYMGPAAEEYIRRRIRIVQRGEPEETLGPDRLDRLAAGIEMTAKVYMSQTRADAFRDEILALKGKHGG